MMINYKKKYLLPSLCLLSCVSMVSIISCNNNNNDNVNVQTQSYNLVIGDGVNIVDLAKSSGLDSSKYEFFAYESSAPRIAKVNSEGTILGKSVGESEISLLDGNSEKVLYKVKVNVSDYTHYDNYEAQIVSGFSAIASTGYLNDIDVGAYVSKGKTYNIDFTYKGTNDGVFQATFSDPNICEWIQDGTNFKLKGLNVGDTILTIYDSNLTPIYKNAIKVRRALSSNVEVMDYLQTVDRFEGYGALDGSFYEEHTNLTFVDDEGHGVWGGSIEGSSIGSNTFSLTYLQYGVVDGIGYENTYRYTISDFTNENGLSYIPVYLDVDETGYNLRLYDSSYLIDFYYPVNN